MNLILGTCYGDSGAPIWITRKRNNHGLKETPDMQSTGENDYQHIQVAVVYGIAKVIDE